MTNTKQCPVCQKEFKERSNKKYCTNECRLAAIREITLQIPSDAGYGTVGAMNELIVCADLMRKGYHVYRALSPQSPCDLVIFKIGETPLRIEVRTSPKMKNGNLRLNMDVANSYKRDVMAFVAGDGSIVYVPDIR